MKRKDIKNMVANIMFGIAMILILILVGAVLKLVFGAFVHAYMEHRQMFVNSLILTGIFYVLPLLLITFSIALEKDEDDK